MSEEEFMDALTDIDEKYIEKAFIAQDVLDELEKGNELASFRRKKLYIIASCIMIVIFGIVLASVTHWLLQRKTGGICGKCAYSHTLYRRSGLALTSK